MLKVIRSFTASNGNYYRIGEEICQGEYDELTEDERMFVEGDQEYGFEDLWKRK